MMMGSAHPLEDAARRQDAADWWVQLHEDTARADSVSQWLEWRARDERNVAAFDEVQRFASGLASFDHSTAGLLVAEFAPAAPRVRYQARRTSAWAAGIAIAISGAAVWLVTSRGEIKVDQHSYATDIAVNQESRLPDGSKLVLGGASKAVAVFSKTRRSIRLETGEAYFEIVKDANRPFLVEAGDITVRAIGTAFNVRRTPVQVAITVTDGRIRVAASPSSGQRIWDVATGIDAGAGQQVVYDARERKMVVSPADLVRALAWRDNRLDFINEPLANVVANINRYSRAQVRLEGAATGEILFTGTVLPEKLDNWLAALPVIFPLQVQKTAAEIVITPRP